MDDVPPEAIIAIAPPALQAVAEELRTLVHTTLPTAMERVRPGWGLIGYDVPVEGRRKPAYFAYIAVEPIHVHLGFEHGWAMRDPGGRLRGAGITRQVRWLTFEPGDPVDHEACAALIREGAAVAQMSRAERLLSSEDS